MESANPDSIGAISTRKEPRAPLKYALVAAFLLGAFWAFASASDWFIDAPFCYTKHDEWSQNLVKSIARGVGREEAALFIASVFTVLPAVLFAALTLRGRAHPLRALERFAAQSGLRFAALSAAIAMWLSWLGSKVVLGGIALIDDERSYLFAARNLVSGTLFRDSAPAAFRNPMVLTAPEWISKYPPGFAAILAPGVWLGLPRLMPMLVCGLSVLAMFQLARSLFGLRTAVIASLLWTFSPFHLAISSTTMIFGTSGCLALWAGALVARGLLEDDERAFFGAAVLSCVHVLVRPFDAGLTLATLALCCAAYGPSRAAARRCVTLGLGFLLGVAGLAAFNLRVFGSPLASGYTSAGDYRFGFFVHSLPGFEYVHTPLQALAHVIVAFARLDGWLVGVPGALALAMLTLLNPNRREKAILLAIALHLLGYSLVASSGTFDVGPTYYYLVAPCYLLLAIRGGLRIQLALAAKHRRIIARAAVAAIPIAWLTVVPTKAMRLKELATTIDAPWSFLAATELNRGLVVVPPFKAMRCAGYALGYPYEVPTRTGTLQLIRPDTQEELLNATRYLHYSGPVYSLSLDENAFQDQGLRRYELRRLELSAKVASSP